jgi:hypothetical protein
MYSAVCSLDDLGGCQTLTMYVHNGEDYKDQQIVAISNVQILVGTTWNVMDSKVLSTFEHHLSRLDEKALLGLSQHSVSCYWLGDVKRIIGAQEMETMSPHQAALGDKAAVIVHLQGLCLLCQLVQLMDGTVLLIFDMYKN